MWAISAECFACVLIFAVFAICSFNKKIAAFICCATIIDFLSKNRFIFYWIPETNTDLAPIPFCYAIGILVALYKEKIIINWYLSIGLLFLSHFFNNCFFTSALQYMTIFSIVLCLAKCKLIANFPKMKDLSYGIFLFGWPVKHNVFVHIFGMLII